MQLLRSMGVIVLFILVFRAFLIFSPLIPVRCRTNGYSSAPASVSLPLPPCPAGTVLLFLPAPHMSSLQRLHPTKQYPPKKSKPQTHLYQ